MFSLCRVLRGVSPFSVFLMDQKNNPALKGLSIVKRGQILAKMYKELSQKQRRDLQKRAESIPSLRKNKPNPSKRKAPKSDFSNFVKANYSKVRGLNYKHRFTALSQLYELQKPVDLAKELKDLGLDEIKIQETLKQIKAKGLHQVPTKTPKAKKATKRIKASKTAENAASKDSTEK